MLEDKDIIKDLFSAKLNDFEADVPASLWAGIDQSLSTPSPVPGVDTVVSTGAKGFTAIKGAVIAACTVALVSVGVYLYTSGEKDIDTSSEIKIEESIMSSADTAEIEEDREKMVSETRIAPIDRRVEKQRPAEVEEVEAILSEKDTVEDLSVTKLKDEEIIKRVKENREPLFPPTGLKREGEIIDDIPLAPIISPEKLAIGFNFRGGVLQASPSQQGGMYSFDRNIDVDKHLIYGDNEFRMKHKQPISFGLTVSKGVTPNLMVETGIVYTYLSSEMHTSPNYIFSEEQKFHYLGIPITLNYTFFRYKKLNVYGSIGGMIQKDIQGQYKASLASTCDQTIVNGVPIPIGETFAWSKKNISQGKIQFSTHINLGISYPIYKKLYLYGTVGGAYYFDANNRYRTIYSDKDTQLDLNLGVKWSF